MKKARLLLLSLPLVGGAFYLRSLASWRPQKLLVAEGRISQLTFSRDGRTLLAVNDPSLQFSGHTRAKTLIALDTQHGFSQLWRSDKYLSYNNGLNPQFIADDSRIFLGGKPRKILDARTGQIVESVTNSFPVAGQVNTIAGEQLPNPKIPLESTFSVAGDSVCAVAVSPDGAYLIGATWTGRLYRQRLK